VGKDGKKRAVPKLQYRRNESAESAAEERRLGHFAHQPPTEDPRVFSVLDEKQLVFICPYMTARAITLTRMLKDRSLHKALTGTDILGKYLDRSGNETATLQDGFSQFHQLFIFFGFIEAPNSYLPSLVTQLVGQRHHEDRHVWLFLPMPVDQMAQQWTPALLTLSYLKTINLHDISAGSSAPSSSSGPVANMPVKKPGMETPPDNRYSRYPPRDKRNDDDDDPKFGRKRKRK